MAVSSKLISEPVPAGHGALIIPDSTGDTRTVWNHADPAQVAETRRRFDEVIAMGYGAYEIPAGGHGEDAVLTRTFPETAERVVMFRQPVGG